MLVRVLLALTFAFAPWGIAAECPAAAARPAPDRAPCPPQKVFPVSLRYRQEIARRIALAGPAAAPRAADGGLPGAAPLGQDADLPRVPRPPDMLRFLMSLQL